MMASKGLLVVKYGGSVLDGGSAIRRAAEAIKREHTRGKRIVVVVSALKGFTDELLSAAEAISPNTPPDVIDHIIGLGEEQSVRLMAAALRTIGVDAVEATPNSPSWPIVTDENHGNAEPILEECRSNAELRLKPLIERGRVPVVCGFVGRSLSGKITTLGRGGSDTTAALLAQCLGAEELVLVKDVEGIYSADPHKVEDAVPLETLEAWDAHLLASNGSKILHSKVFMNKNDGLPIRIASSSGSLGEGGTVIRGNVPNLILEQYDKPVLKVTVIGDVMSNPESLARISKIIGDWGGKTLSSMCDDRASTFYVDGAPVKVLNGLHSHIKCTDDLRAVSGVENQVMIVLRGRGIDDAGGLLEKVVGHLSSMGIDTHGSMMGNSSIRLLVDWDNREKSSQLIEEELGKRLR